MRCKRARRLLELKASQGLSPRDGKLLADHLTVCPECAEMETQLERTWEVLGHYLPVEPSPDFLPRMKARLRAERPAPRPGWNWHPRLGWQWLALAACVALFAVLLSKSGQLRQDDPGPSPAVKTATDHDRADDQFLEDLERTLQHSDADYLSTYDSWPAAMQDFVGPEPSPAKLGKAIRKEIS